MRARRINGQKFPENLNPSFGHEMGNKTMIGKKRFLIIILLHGILLVTFQAPAAAQDQGIGESVKTAERLKVYLTGRVTLEDGAPPEGMQQVELVCGNQITQQVFLDSKGRFIIEVGEGTRTTWADASMGNPDAGIPDPTGGIVIPADPNDPTTREESFANSPLRGIGEIDLTDCELRVQRRPGFTSKPILLGLRSVFDKTEVGSIVLRPTSRTSGNTISAKPAIRTEALKAYEQARTEMQSEQVSYSKAREKLEKAVKLHPEYAPAWNLLGHAQLGLDDPVAARGSFQKAIDTDPSFVSPYIELTRMAVGKGQWSKAVELTGRAKELDPTKRQIRYYDGLANYHLGQFEVAEESFRFLEQGGHWQQFPTVYFFLGMMDAQKGEIALAMDEFRKCLKYAPETLVPKETREQMARQLKSWEQQIQAENETRTPVSNDELAGPADNTGNIDMASSSGPAIVELSAELAEANPNTIWVGLSPIRMVVTAVPAGVLIEKVRWRDGAWLAGLRKEDIVISLNGEKPDKAQFGNIFLRISRGEIAQAVFTVRRGGEELRFQVRRFQGQKTQ